MHFGSIPPITIKTRFLPPSFVLLLFLTATLAPAQGVAAVAYVVAEAPGPGKRGDTTRPYTSLQQALQLIQWDCDGSNPRLAGVYELPELLPPNRFNRFIDGVPVWHQQYVDAGYCQIFGVASNFRINPIKHLIVEPPPFVWIQFIHGARDIDKIDVYIDGMRWVDDLQDATPYLPIPRGRHTIDVVAADDPDNANPLWTLRQPFIEPHDYALITVGGRDSLGVFVQNNALRVANTDGVEFFFIHDLPETPVFDIILLDPRVPNQVEGILLKNFKYGTMTPYRRLEPRAHAFRITTAGSPAELKRFRFDLKAFGGETLIFLLTGRFDDGSFTIIGYDAQGNVLAEVPVHLADEAAVPEAFMLRGNYPNPFNPATRVVFDLPETARVHLEIVDLLGRTVLTTPAQRMEAGAGRAVTVEASRLASGVYLYRVVAQAVTATQIRTGRMVLAR